MIQIYWFGVHLLFSLLIVFSLFWLLLVQTFCLNSSKVQIRSAGFLSLLQKSAACENVNNHSVCAAFTNVYMSSHCAHALVSRPYPWRGLVFPSSPLISVSRQQEPPPHHHLHLHREPTGGQPEGKRKEKKINSFSISQLSVQTTACESPFSGNGWLTGTSIGENLYKTHYCTTCHRVIPEAGGGGKREAWIYLWFACELSHLLSLLLKKLVLGLTWSRLHRLPVGLEGFWFSCAKCSRKHCLHLIDPLMNLSSLPGPREPGHNPSHLLTSSGRNPQYRLHPSWHQRCIPERIPQGSVTPLNNVPHNVWYDLPLCEEPL